MEQFHRPPPYDGSIRESKICCEKYLTLFLLAQQSLEYANEYIFSFDLVTLTQLNISVMVDS